MNLSDYLFFSPVIIFGLLAVSILVRVKARLMAKKIKISVVVINIICFFIFMTLFELIDSFLFMFIGWIISFLYELILFFILYNKEIKELLMFPKKIMIFYVKCTSDLYKEIKKLNKENPDLKNDDDFTIISKEYVSNPEDVNEKKAFSYMRICAMINEDKINKMLMEAEKQKIMYCEYSNRLRSIYTNYNENIKKHLFNSYYNKIEEEVCKKIENHSTFEVRIKIEFRYWCIDDKKHDVLGEWPKIYVFGEQDVLENVNMIENIIREFEERNKEDLIK